LLHDAGLGSIKPMVEHYLGFVRFTDRRHFPDVDVSAEKGSGLATPVADLARRRSRCSVGG
jgi:lecithin-cholesterol acyltransferase